MVLRAAAREAHAATDRHREQGNGALPGTGARRPGARLHEHAKRSRGRRDHEGCIDVRRLLVVPGDRCCADVAGRAAVRESLSCGEKVLLLVLLRAADYERVRHRRLEKDHAMRLTLNTVQGIGDLFWVYQKVAPHVDAMRLNILCTKPNDIVQRRSDAFLRMLPKVEEVRFIGTAHTHYAQVSSTRYGLDAILNHAGGRAVDYAVNAPLER